MKINTISNINTLFEQYFFMHTEREFLKANKFGLK